MGITVFASHTPELEDQLAERRRLGLDRRDELWRGEYHMVPGPHGRHGRAALAFHDALRPLLTGTGLTPTADFNLGEEGDFRMPDLGYHKGDVEDPYLATAAIVVEVLSPGDETCAKFDFYAERGVEEIVVVDPDRSAITWYRLEDGDYRPVTTSAAAGIEVDAVRRAMVW